MSKDNSTRFTFLLLGVLLTIPMCCGGFCVLGAVLATVWSAPSRLSTRAPRAATPGKESHDPSQTVLTITADVSLENKVVVRGSTNLPRGTELVLHVQEDAPIGFLGQAGATVGAGGGFGPVEFGPKRGLLPGRYAAAVTMPVALNQPENVRRIIGAEGEKLRGSLVHETPLGKYVSAEIKILVGGGGAVDEQRRRNLGIVSDADTYISSIRALRLRLDEASKQLKPKSKDVGDLYRWGEFARSFVREQQSLYKSAFIDSLPPSSLKFQLGMACSYLYNMFSALLDNDMVEYAKWSAEIDGELSEASQEVAKVRDSCESNKTDSSATNR